MDDATKQRIRQLWHAGFDTQEIARQLGVPESQVYNALHVIRETQRQAREALASARIA